MPAIYHTQEVDASFEGAIFHVTEAQPTDPVIWHCQEVDANFNGAIFHIMWADENYNGPVWKVVGIARVIEVVLKGVPPITMVGAVEDSLAYVKAYGGLLQSGVPSGYTAVEYVENTTNTMVKTAIHIGNDDNFKIDITATAVTGSFYLFQARDKVNSSLGNANITGISGATSGNTLLASPGIDGVAVSNGLTRVNRTGHKMRFVYECADGNITWYVRDLDGNVENTATGTYDPTQLNRATTNMCIYGNEAPAGSGSGQQANRLAPGCKVYGAKLWKNGILVLDYVPATRDSDSAIGFYDKISDTFVTAADGSLTAGNSLAPTPSDPVDLVCNNGALKVLDKSQWTIFTNPNPDPIPGQGVWIDTSGKWKAVGDNGAGCAIPLTIGKQYTMVIHKKTTELGTMLRYGQSPQATPTSAGIQLTDWYRGGIADGQMISFVAKLPYLVMQLSAVATEAGMVQEAIEVLEAAGDNETLAITTKNLFDKDNLTLGYYYYTAGVYTADAQQGLSDWIVVLPSTTYTITTKKASGSASGANCRVNYFDEDKTFLSQDILLTNRVQNFTTPVNTKYVRVSWPYTGMFAIDNNFSQIELGSVATDYVAYNASTATANNLFAVNTYKDVQEIITGATTHKVNVYVLNGEETAWNDVVSSSSYAMPKTALGSDSNVLPNKSTDVICSHYSVLATESGVGVQDIVWVGGSNVNFKTKATYATLQDWKDYLAAQYAAGTPVVVVCPLATAQDEVAPIPQTMQVVAGDNTLDIVQAGMSGLEVSATYMKGVSVTITEIENANVGNDVEVVIA